MNILGVEGKSVAQMKLAGGRDVTREVMRALSA